MVTPAITVTFRSTKVGTLYRKSDAQRAPLSWEFSPEYVRLVREKGHGLIPKFTPAWHDLSLDSSEQIISPGGTMEGLPALLWNSMPDAWGSAVMSTVFGRMDIPDTPLNRLAYIGNRGMGGLVFSPALSNGDPNEEFAERITATWLDELSNIFGGDGSQLIDAKQLKRFAENAGMPGGAHPKCLVGCEWDSGELVWGADTDALAASMPGYVPSILKLDYTPAGNVANPRYTENLTRIEYAYHLMALAAGLKPARCRLVKMQDGNGLRRHLVIERFDRVGEVRHHQLSYAALIRRRPSRGAERYETMAGTFRGIPEKVDGLKDLFRRAVFNYATGVTDDHTKNFALLYTGEGWSLSPPYDLVWHTSANHATTIGAAGSPESVQVGALRELADACRLGREEARDVMHTVIEATGTWEKSSEEAEIAPEMIRQIRVTISNARTALGRLGF